MPLRDYFDKIVLASQSPARLDLLKKQELEVITAPQDCEEVTTEKEPGKVVESLSMLKLESFIKNNKVNTVPVIACDTLLWFENNLIGKACSDEEARKQISMLSGRTHLVFSGYALLYKGKIYNGWDSAEVTFNNISELKLDDYIKSQQWRGAAGSYHIFGKAVDFIQSVRGDINTVIGLPLCKIDNLLKSLF